MKGKAHPARTPICGRMGVSVIIINMYMYKQFILREAKDYFNITLGLLLYTFAFTYSCCRMRLSRAA